VYVGLSVGGAQQDGVGKKKAVSVDESVLERADPADVMEFHDWPMPLPDDAGRVRAAHPPPGQVDASAPHTRPPDRSAPQPASVGGGEERVEAGLHCTRPLRLIWVMAARWGVCRWDALDGRGHGVWCWCGLVSGAGAGCTTPGW
jgi:hypothetical protein